MFCTSISFSNLIKQDKLFINEQYDNEYQSMKNIHHQQEVHQDFCVESQKGENHEMFFLY